MARCKGKGDFAVAATTTIGQGRLSVIRALDLLLMGTERDGQFAG